MKITLLLTGKTTEKNCLTLLQEYTKRIARYVEFKVVEIPEIKFSASTTPELIREKEYILQKKHIEKSDFVILLDETGKQFTSAGFAEYLQKKQIANVKHMIIIVGGSYGFSKSLYSEAHEKMSLSFMTFPHQLVRVIFTEQLYRAFTILNNEQYHH